MTYWDEKKSTRTQLELGNYPNRPCSRAEWRRAEAKCREVGTITVEDEAWLQGCCNVTWFPKGQDAPGQTKRAKDTKETICLVEEWNIRHYILWDMQYGQTLSQLIKNNLIALASNGGFQYDTLDDLAVQLTGATDEFLARYRER